ADRSSPWSSLDAVKEVHAILEPAGDAGGIGRREQEPEHAQPPPWWIAPRELERIARAPEEQVELLAVDAAEQAATPEREQDHRPSAARDSSSRQAASMPSMTA